MVQTGNIYYNVNIFGLFWSKLGYLTSWAPIYRDAPSYYAIDIEDIALWFDLDVFLWLLCVI